FFFFQAEDGIRDRTVTGVQTCALPILFEFDFNSCCRDEIAHLRNEAMVRLGGPGKNVDEMRTYWQLMTAQTESVTSMASAYVPRSEERRVGKEGRCWWARKQSREECRK